MKIFYQIIIYIMFGFLILTFGCENFLNPTQQSSNEIKLEKPPITIDPPYISRYNHPDHPKIGWIAVDDEWPISGYKVYRSLTEYPGDPSGTYYHIATLDSSTTYYIDSSVLLTKVKTERAWYKITVYIGSWYESEFSNYQGFVVEEP